MVEVPNGDFAHTVARLLLFATVRLAAFERLASHRDPLLAAIAAKGVKELTYHRDYAGRWFLTLAQGTDESRRRLLAGLTAVWPLYDELRTTYSLEERADAEVDVVLDQVFAVSGVERPDVLPMSGSGHTEALSRMLAEMQVVARAHPRGLW
jgi:ring-1,2-phenylacetyl-CoA epoxidase subunit PaaC